MTNKTPTAEEAHHAMQLRSAKRLGITVYEPSTLPEMSDEQLAEIAKRAFEDFKSNSELAAFIKRGDD